MNWWRDEVDDVYYLCDIERIADAVADFALNSELRKCGVRCHARVFLSRTLVLNSLSKRNAESPIPHVARSPNRKMSMI